MPNRPEIACVSTRRCTPKPCACLSANLKSPCQPPTNCPPTGADPLDDTFSTSLAARRHERVPLVNDPGGLAVYSSWAPPSKSRWRRPIPIETTTWLYSAIKAVLIHLLLRNGVLSAVPI